MSAPNQPPRSRRILLLFGGLVALCLCLVVVIALVSLPTFSGTATAPNVSATQPAAGAARTPTEPIAGAVPSSLPPGTRRPSPAPTYAMVIGSTGELRLDYPITLAVDKDEIVTVEIVPDQPVAFVGDGGFAPPAKLLVEAGSGDAPRKTASYQIPLYPAMSAELATARQDLSIVAGSESKQEINPYDKNFWTWSLVARRGGEYRITLRVFGYAALADEDPLKQVVSDTRIVHVNDRPFLENLTRGLAENWLVLFGAGGPIALILAALSFWFARRDSQKPK